jgi:AbrB family looped-hinge helix DNA binding protein
MLRKMKITRRGQVTIPKDLRERFGLKPETEVEFQVVNNSILLRKRPGKLNLTRWKGRCRKSFKVLGYTRVDEFIGDVRGVGKG